MPFTWRRGEKGYQIDFLHGGVRAPTLTPPPLLECTQLNYFLNIFSEEHTLESSGNKVEQRYIRTAQLTKQARDVLLFIPGSRLAQKSHSLYV